jgi:hypothetical protein
MPRSPASNFRISARVGDDGITATAGSATGLDTIFLAAQGALLPKAMFPLVPLESTEPP